MANVVQEFEAVAELHHGVATEVRDKDNRTMTKTTETMNQDNDNDNVELKHAKMKIS